MQRSKNEKLIKRGKIQTSNFARKLTLRDTKPKNEQVAQLSQRDHAEGGLVMAKSGILELRDNIYRYYYLQIQPVWRIWPAKQSNSVKNAKRAITPFKAFKVIEVGTNGKPICDFLLVINSNWQPISYRCGVIAAYCSNFGHFAFLSHPLGGLGTMYDVHLRFIGKRVRGLPISDNWTFFARCYGWGAMGENR